MQTNFLGTIMYYGHYKIIKCICFNPIHCAMKLNIVLYFIVFSGFDYVFLSNVFIVRINRIIFIKKKFIFRFQKESCN